MHQSGTVVLPGLSPVWTTKLLGGQLSPLPLYNCFRWPVKQPSALRVGKRQRALLAHGRYVVGQVRAHLLGVSNTTEVPAGK